MTKLLVAVLVGGAFGSVLRFLVAVVTPRQVFGLVFPLSTFVVNVTGSLLIGVVSALLPRGSLAYTFLATGVLGGFTTYSAFSLDAIDLLSGRSGARPAVGLLYVVATTVVCVTACWVGIKLGVWCSGRTEGS